MQRKSVQGLIFHYSCGGSNGATESTSSSSTILTTPVTSSETLGSRGEVEGSSNQPSPTCVTDEIDQNYWNAVNSSHDSAKSTAVSRVHEMLVEDLNRTKKQLADLHQLVSFFLAYFDLGKFCVDHINYESWHQLRTIEIDKLFLTN